MTRTHPTVPAGAAAGPHVHTIRAALADDGLACTGVLEPVREKVPA